MRSIRRQYEDDVRVFPQTIHLIEQFVQKNFGAGAGQLLTGPRDQINVFNNDHRWLQHASQTKVLIQQSELFGSDQKRGVTFKMRREVVDGVRLARAGWTVKQQSFLSGHPEGFDMRARPNEVPDIVIDHSQSLVW